MKSKTPLLGVLLVGALVALFTAGAASMNSVTYEYRVVDRRARDPQEILNQLGKEGWELVAVAPPPASNSFETYYLKRQIH